MKEYNRLLYEAYPPVRTSKTVNDYMVMFPFNRYFCVSSYVVK